MNTQNISIDWGNGVCAIPDKAADGIMLADITSLRFMLFTARQKRFPTASEIGCDEEKLEDAVNFWLELGVLRKQETAPITEPVKKAKPSPPEYRTLTPAHIAESLTNFPDLRHIFNEVESIKGKPLNHTEQQTFVWIYEYLGLSPITMIMLYGFAASIGKTGAAYIVSVASDWAQRDINDPDSAEAEILACEKRISQTEQIKAMLVKYGLAGNHSDRAAKWQRNSYDMGLIEYALDYAKRKNKLTIEYVDKTLSALIKSGATTAEDARQREQSYEQNAKKPAAVTSGGNAEKIGYEYDGNALMDKALARLMSDGAALRKRSGSEK